MTAVAIPSGFGVGGIFPPSGPNVGFDFSVPRPVQPQRPSFGSLGTGVASPSSYWARNFLPPTANKGFDFTPPPPPPPKRSVGLFGSGKTASTGGFTFGKPAFGTGGFTFGSSSTAKIVNFPVGIVCVDHLNDSCSEGAQCRFAHRSSFSTKFTFSEQNMHTVDLVRMQQVSHSTGFARKIRQNPTTGGWEYQGDNGLFLSYAPADEEVIRSRLSHGGKIDCSPLLKPNELQSPEVTDDGIVFRRPSWWGGAVVKEVHCELVKLEKGSKEWEGVRKTMEGTGNVVVVDVVRVQNKHLMTQYQMRKYQKEVERGCKLEEMMLFHGTSIPNINKILNSGFDSTLSSTSGLCGTGIYFATTSAYSTSYTKPHPDGTESMFISRVLTGISEPRSGLSMPIRRPSPVHDSVVDNAASPVMYVVYYNTEAVPEYLVNFKRS